MIGEYKLKIHKTVHTGEIHYACRYYENGFSPACDLEIPKEVHPVKTPYDCNKCEKSFSHAANLKKHKPIHTKETPYAASVKRYSQTGDLKNTKSSHRRDYFGTIICFVCSRLPSLHLYLQSSL